MELINENTTRRIDGLGRIGIPKGIRNRLRLEPNTEMELFTLRLNGRDYIAFTPIEEKEVDDRYATVAELLNELGIAIPEEIIEKLG